MPLQAALLLRSPRCGRYRYRCYGVASPMATGARNIDTGAMECDGCALRTRLFRKAARSNARVRAFTCGGHEREELKDWPNLR